MFFMINATSVFAVLFLVFLEGILSLDNALVLALMVKNLPAHQQRKALTWGIWGAFGFRFVALFFLSQIMRVPYVKVIGSLYLFFVAIKGLTQEEIDPPSSASRWGLWRTILLVELVDITFSADSIMAAVSLSQNYWIILTGGILGIVMMRFAAILFIKLIKAFPRMATTAYLLVFTIAAKLLIEGIAPRGIDFHNSTHPEGWLFWAAMVACLFYGLKRKTKRSAA